MERWKHFSKIDFNNKKFNQFHIDTRDFSVLCKSDNPDIVVPEKIGKLSADKIVFSADEVSDQIKRIHQESGGDVQWRYLSFYGPAGHKYSNNWGLKYIRIFRVDGGFLICNKDFHPMTKNVLSSKIDINLLNAH